MKILKFDNAQLGSKCLASEIYQAIKENSTLNMAVATGRTMDSVYNNLYHLHQKNRLDCSKVKTFALDEYIGLGKNHENSYEAYLKFHLYEPLGFNLSNTHIPDVHLENYEKSAFAYEEKINKLGGLDFAILGIGVNGHIALNEPGSAHDSKTRVVALSSTTIQSNKSLFKSDRIPLTAMTMGIGTIRGAKKIYLIATGETKAQVIKSLIEGEISSDLPASFLKSHPDFTLILDNDSSKLVK